MTVTIYDAIRRKIEVEGGLRTYLTIGMPSFSFIAAHLLIILPDLRL